MRFLLIVLLVPISIWCANAQNSNDARDVTSTYYIKNAFVVQKPGTVLSATSILIKDGIIAGVGKNIKVPFDALVIDADSMYVYPAFIDACSHAGIVKPENEKRPDVRDPGNPPKDIAGITPQHTVRDAMSEKVDKSLSELQQLGFGYVHAVPRGRMLPGQGSVITTGGGTTDEILLRENVSQFLQFRSAPGVFPATTIGVMSQFRDLVKNAELALAYDKTYESDPNNLDRPKKSAELSALYPMIEKRQMVFFNTSKVKDINRALILQNELGIDLVFIGVRQGWPLLDEMKVGMTSSKKKGAVSNQLVLSMDLPKKIEEEKSDDKKGKKDQAESKEGEEKVAKKKSKKDKDSPEVKALKERKKKSHDQYVGQAAMMEKRNVKFSFTTMDTKSKDIKPNLLRMIEGGLSETAALSALTTTPAALLGISNVAGTVEKGKIANLFVTDKSYFEEKSNIKYIFSDGLMIEKEQKKKKKSKDGEQSEIGGTWSYSVEIPGTTQSGTIVISGSGDDLDIEVDSSDEPGEFTTAENIAVDGNDISFDLTIDGMTYSLSASIEGDDLDGSVTVGEFGTFPMKGTRIPE